MRKYISAPALLSAVTTIVVLAAPILAGYQNPH